MVMKLSVLPLLLVAGSVSGGALPNTKNDWTNLGELVDKINSLDLTFTARHYPKLDHLSTMELRQFYGGNLHKRNKRPVPKKSVEHHAVSPNDPPASFDVSTAWPDCKDIFEDITIQGNCSSSWAIATANSIRDRRCIRYGNRDPISAWDVISCCEDCVDGLNDGCNGGGDHDSAFNYYINDGIVTGGNQSDHKFCMPYPIKTDAKVNQPKNIVCKPTCQSRYKNHTYAEDKSVGRDYTTFAKNNMDLMNEIIARGPVVAEFDLYADFLVYSGGIYLHTGSDKPLGKYYAKILGWGVDHKGQSYWRASTSFDKNWGYQGTFQIAKGGNNVDGVGFQNSVIAGFV